MRISVIACINEKRALGKDNDLLYKLSGDLRSFKLMTKGNIVIMGKNTWESLPVKPLPERVNIVLTKDGVSYDEESNFEEICKMEPIKVKSLEEALRFSEDLVGWESESEVFIIGGASLYKEVLEKRYADRLYITEVLDDSDGDVYFPEFEQDMKWELWFQTAPIVDEKTKVKYRYKFYRDC